MYLVLIHVGGGSMVEGADAQVVLGPFPTEEAAREAEDEFYNIVRVNEFLRAECWPTRIEIPTTPLDVKAEAEKLLAEMS